jgi:hypothetical protein
MSDHPLRYPSVTEGVPAEALPDLTVKQQRFAQCYAAHGNATRAYREAFEIDPGIRAGWLRQRAYDLVHEPRVAARVRELLAEAAEGTTISARARMVRLQDIIEADPSELVHIVAEACAQCWTDPMALAAALDRAATGDPIPDTDSPQSDCTNCRGYGVRRVVITATDHLSPSARKLLKAVRQKPDGTIEVQMHDQLSASDQLNRMQGVYVDKSVSLNINAHVEPLRDMTPAEIAELIQQQKQIR